MNQLNTKWIRYISASWAVIQACLVTGCLSPKTIEPLARQNEENIANYNANVAKVVTAFLHEDAILRQLMLHQAQDNVAKALVPVRQTIMLPATDPNVANASQPWVVAVQQKADALKQLLRDVSDDQTHASLAGKNPAIYDIAAGTPGFNAQRVILVCLTLDELNGLIVNATEPEIARVYQLKRAKLLSAYFPVQRQMELNQTYEKALGQFLATVEQQANISSNHAKAFIGYAQAQPAFDSLKSVIQNEGLRGAVLDLVSKNKGPAAANELKANLGKADQIIGLFGTN